MPISVDYNNGLRILIWSRDHRSKSNILKCFIARKQGCSYLAQSLPMLCIDIDIDIEDLFNVEYDKHQT